MRKKRATKTRKRRNKQTQFNNVKLEPTKPFLKSSL